MTSRAEQITELKTSAAGASSLKLCHELSAAERGLFTDWRVRKDQLAINSFSPDKNGERKLKNEHLQHK